MPCGALHSSKSRSSKSRPCACSRAGLALVALISTASGCASDTAGGADGAAAASSSAAGGATSSGAGGAPASGSGAATSGGAPSGSGAAGAGNSGGTGGASTAGGSGGTGGASASDVIQALREYLALARASRPALEEQEFARTALSEDEADEARLLLWDDYAALVRETRQAESEARLITLDGYTLRYDFTVFGDAPGAGRSLYLSLHGGGEAEPSVNDQQWENQKGLYQPDEGIYLSPRAPTDTWNLWHQPHIDALFERLVTNLVVLEGVDPNRVYVMGYSAGGDGVYQLGPRMADHWAAAAMMAGHPNDARPESLRNIGFTIHVGGLDTAFDRNLVAEEWGTLLDELRTDDPDGYAHYVEVHADKPHWMDLQDAVAVPWMAEFTRDPAPDRVVWLQDDVTHARFYWLAVDAENAAPGAQVTARYGEQQVTVEATGVSRLKVRLSDAMLDLDQPVSVVSGGASLFEGNAERTISTLYTTTLERGDPALVWSSEVEVVLP